jgi:hypothetical protein
MNYTESEKTLILTCWALRDQGQHGWSPRARGWLTVEPMNDPGGIGNYMAVTYTDKIDDLGYPCGNIINTDYIDAARIKRITRRNKKKNLS